MPVSGGLDSFFLYLNSFCCRDGIIIYTQERIFIHLNLQRPYIMNVSISESKCRKMNDGGLSMRECRRYVDNWIFLKEDAGVLAAADAAGERVTLPHTWNAADGQDGGNDYYRGTCWYVKKEGDIRPREDQEVWLEFRGAAMSAKVYVNGRLAGSHDGGYSTFRVNLTEYLAEENVIAVAVDNRPCRTVYPQKADFTFYGGIYRDVYLLTVPKAHFALGYYGGSGVKATPQIEGKDARIAVEIWTENTADGTEAKLEIMDAERNLAAETSVQIRGDHASAELVLRDVHLWNGKKDPYLYTLKAVLSGDSLASDETETTFGCRTYYIDPEKGFFLNGEPYPLCGAARHQDRQGAGNALTPEMHEEDLRIMMEMGANTVRAAHYQHDQYFYDLADRRGMIVWAEIPYITEHLPEARANTVSQMTELVVQNYHHPSVICWALSNEITATGGVSEDLVENHRILNDLCHKLDSTRVTAMAHVFMLNTEEELVALPDICSYNLYYGWYVGSMEDNEAWFDRFHEEHPGTVIGLSEYGADANPQYQSAKPEKGDYTESYQALYHEHMLKMWKERPYIWAMHVWNMFDFGADGRSEGGKPGQNQKGLVTFDRKIKKDAFYIYKAYLSDEPFVHLCGRRYVDRTEAETEIKMYSNQPEVTLYVDGEERETQAGDKVFCFQVPISGEHEIEVRSGELTDRMKIRRAAEPNPEYVCPGHEVINWFDRPDMEKREGYYSIEDCMNDLYQSPEAAAAVDQIMAKAAEAYGDVAQEVEMPADVQEMMGRQSLIALLKMAGSVVTPEMVVELNQALSKVKKPE